MLKRTTTIWMCFALTTTLVLAGCGDDDGGAAAVGGTAGSAASGGSSGSGGAGGSSGSAGSDPDGGVVCGAGSQDNDGDGICGPSCSASTDCGRGTCDDGSGEIQCACDRNFVGTLCDVCTIGTMGTDCDECATNFFVDESTASGCREDFCATMTCPANATCSNTPTGAICGCNIGFDGSLCDVCATGYAAPGCVTCDTGYTEGPGPVFTCVPDICDGVDCNYGICVSNGGVAACQCVEGFALPDCSTCLDGWTLSPTGVCFLTPPATNTMVLWLDASDESSILTDVNNEVYRWDNKIPGAANDDFWYGPANRRPTLSTDGDRTRMVFNGTNDTLRKTFDLTNPSYDIFVVTKWNATGAGQGIIGGTDMNGSIGHGLWLQAKDADTVHFRHRYPFASGSGSELDADGFNASAGLQLIHARRRAPARGDHIAVGEANSALTELSPLESMPFGESLNTFLACNGPSGNGPLDGEIAEIIIYEGLLSEVNRAAVVAYLTAKWDL